MNLQQRYSLCPKELSVFLNETASIDQHQYFDECFNRWVSTLRKLASILRRANLEIFISYAWHLDQHGNPVDNIASSFVAGFYDQINLQLARILSAAGFIVYYDKNINNAQSIQNLGLNPFIEKIHTADVIISIVTPLYSARSNNPSSGVKAEVDLIQSRLNYSSKIGFYIPLLVSWDRSVAPSTLLVGQNHPRMKEAVYLDWRDKSAFISNIWQLLHRLWINIKPNFDDRPDGQEHKQRYISILGDLLSASDYYDENNQPRESSIKGTLCREYNTLRIFTTPFHNIEPIEIAMLIQQEIGKVQDLLNTLKNKHIVAFLGNTGAGKSTLINFLARKSLVMDVHEHGYQLVDRNDPEAMQIGDGLESETLYPQAIECNGLLLVDLPGFNDTDGTIRTLINAAFTRKILLEAASVRLVFVAGQDEITAGRGLFIKTLFHVMLKAFICPGILEQCSMFIMTKSTFPYQARDRAWRFLKDRIGCCQPAFKQQLNTWEQNFRSWHIPIPCIHELTDENREDLLSSIFSMRSALPHDMEGFNVSGFYSTETNIPLQQMFTYFMERDMDSSQYYFPDRTMWKLLKGGKTKDKALISKSFCWIPTEVWRAEYHKFKNSNNDALLTLFDQHIENMEEIRVLKDLCLGPFLQARKEVSEQFLNGLEPYRQLVLKWSDTRQIVDLHSAAYSRFIQGKLVFQGQTDKRMFPFLNFARTLTGKVNFDGLMAASRFSFPGLVSDLLAVRIGCPEGEAIISDDKEERLTIWIVPKFLLMRSNCPFKIVEWKSDIGIFWTKATPGISGLDQFDYVTDKSFEEISNKNLCELWEASSGQAPNGSICECARQTVFCHSWKCLHQQDGMSRFSIQFP